jgi:microcystin-dependent protein
MSRDKFLPSLIDLLDHRIDIALSSMNCVSLGTIQSFDPASQTATISVNYKRIIKEARTAENGIDTEDEIMEYPILVKCPVFVLSGGVAALTLPIAKGDTCLILFCDREIDTWFRTGVVTFPQSDRMHHLTDAVALVGIRSTQNALASFNSIIASLVDKTGERLAQSGFGQPYFGTVLPSGWLWCDGSAVSRTTYDLLYAVIGTTYGAGNGSTTFNVPDMRGQVAVGIGGTLALTLGQEFGEVNHLLTGPESGIQAHQHPIGGNKVLGSGGSYEWINNTGTLPGQTAITGPTDAQSSHNNVQPSLGINWIIKI